MKRLLLSLGCVGVLACGVGQTRKTDSSRLALGAPTGAITLMAGGDPVFMRLVVVGSEAQGASIAATQLPDFVTLDGWAVRMAPGRGVAPGSYTASFTATSGEYASTAEFTIDVSRYTTALEFEWQEWMEGSDTKVLCVAGPPSEQPFTAEACRFDGTPRFTMRFADAEDDDLHVELELVPLGTAFTGVPTHSTWLHSQPSNPKHPVGEVTVDGLVDGTTYAVAMRVCDEAGGCWAMPRAPHLMAEGWNDKGQIAKGCATGTSCGAAAGATCTVNSDCSSRNCDLSGGGYIGVWPGGNCL